MRSTDRRFSTALSVVSARSATTIRSTRTVRWRPRASSSAPMTPTRPPSTSRNRATTGRSFCAPRMPPSPAPSTPRFCSRKAPRRPVSSSKCAASRRMATGPMSGTSSRSAPPIGAAGRRRIHATPPPISPAPSGTTRASSARTSTSSCFRPARSSTMPSARRCTIRWR
ncbi:hypothetical protein D3C71_1640220 [compost metagenome]